MLCSACIYICERLWAHTINICHSHKFLYMLTHTCDVVQRMKLRRTTTRREREWERESVCWCTCICVCVGVYRCIYTHIYACRLCISLKYVYMCVYVKYEHICLIMCCARRGWLRGAEGRERERERERERSYGSLYIYQCVFGSTDVCIYTYLKTHTKHFSLTSICICSCIRVCIRVILCSARGWGGWRRGGGRPYWLWYWCPDKRRRDCQNWRRYLLFFFGGLILEKL